jgi:hypothetical protein
MRAAIRTSWSLAVLLAALLAVPASVHAAATHYALSFRVTSTTAGTVVTGFVEPADDMGNQVFSLGVIHFSSSDPDAILPLDTQVTSGGIFGVTFRTAGPQTVTATLVDGSLTGTSPPLPVGPAAVSRLTVEAPSTLATTGIPLPYTVTARDRFLNPVPAYAGTLHFTSSDPNASLPADTQLTGGEGDFSATLRAAGTQTITASDAAGGPAVTAAISVARPATHLQLVGPASTLAGFPAVVGVRALDATGAFAFTYDGTVSFASSDDGAQLPDDVDLVNGRATVTTTFNTTGPQTISATDTTDATIAGTSPQLLVGQVDDPGPPPKPPAPPPPAPPAPAPLPSPPSSSPPPLPVQPVPSAPAVRDLTVKPLCVRRARLLGAPTSGHGALGVSFSLSAGANVSLTVARLVHAKAPARCPRRAGSTAGALRSVKAFGGSAPGGRNAMAIAARAGRRTIALAGSAAAAKALAPGAYVVQVRATDAAGRPSATATAKFFVLR